MHTTEMSAKGYVGIFLVLMALTAVTVGVAFVDLGLMSPVVALAIAATKATLVGLYFMHVRFASRLIALYAAAGIVWLGILLTLTLTDYGARPWLGVPGR
jgi:cytochrome c oxidase subunit IV